jgi:formate-dependent nitrite reductase membrane component NrfD
MTAMRGEERMVPKLEPRSYYGRPVLKEPVWTPEIPVYFFCGGLAGASAGLAFLAGVRGDDELARRAWAAALLGIGVSPALLISDLGVPRRFLNMLRMFRPSSPMSVGSWILSASGATTTLAAVNAWTGLFPAGGRVAKALAAALGLPLSTYTAALISSTSVPAWRHARYELPIVFGAGAAASAGAAALVATRVEDARPARRLALAAVAVEALAAEVMEKRLGEIGEVYRHGRAGTAKRAAQVLNLAGFAVVAARRRDRAAQAAGGGLLLAGALAERFSIFRAGFQSAADPKHTVGPQREAIEHGARRGAARLARRYAAPDGPDSTKALSG